MSSNKPLAAIYIRVSTQDQAQHGFSLDAQEESLVNYAKALGYEILKIYKDEGKSAKTLNRPEMINLLKDAEAKKFQAIFIYKLDRFSRSLKDLILTIDKLKEWGIDFVSLQDKIETASASGKLMFQIIGAFAEFERNIIGDRTKFGMEKITSEIEQLLLKRVVDISVYCPKVKVYYNNTIIPVRSFKDYMKMFLTECLCRSWSMNGFWKIFP